MFLRWLCLAKFLIFSFLCLFPLVLSIVCRCHKIQTIDDIWIQRRALALFLIWFELGDDERILWARAHVHYKLAKLYRRPGTRGGRGPRSCSAQTRRHAFLLVLPAGLVNPWSASKSNPCYNLEQIVARWTIGDLRMAIPCSPRSHQDSILLHSVTLTW